MEQKTTKTSTGLYLQVRPFPPKLGLAASNQLMEPYPNT